MINETILLLVYYYRQHDGDRGVLRHITSRYCGAYLPFDLYIGQPLQKIFSRVIVFDYLKRRAEVGLRQMNQEVIELVSREHPKYVLWVSFYDDIQPSTLAAIRREGSKVIGWFFDDEWRFDEYSRYWVPCLDYCVTNAIDAVPKYRELGARVIQTVPNTGIAIEPDWANLKEKYDVTFVGTRLYGDRNQWIGELKRRNISLHLFGPGSGGYVSLEEMLDIFTHSKVNLNFSKAGGHPVRQIKGRVFQSCMAGGFMLTESTPGIEKYFEIDREIVCFDTPMEMADKITYYLGHDDERRTIARAGWAKASRQWTSSRMVAAVFDQIESEPVSSAVRDSPCPFETVISDRARAILSLYNFQWGGAWVQENDDRGLWKESLRLSLAYRPRSLIARYCYTVGHLPSAIRSPLFLAYRALERLHGWAFFWLVVARSQLSKRLWPKAERPASEKV